MPEMLIAFHTDPFSEGHLLQNVVEYNVPDYCKNFIILEFYQQSVLTLTNSPSSGRDPKPSLCLARNKSIILTLRSQPLKINGSLWVPADTKFEVVLISPLYPLF